jgi:hypothetical protein
MLLCERKSLSCSCVSAGSRVCVLEAGSSRVGKASRGFAAVSARIGEEANDHLLCRRAAVEAHGERHGWPDQKLLVARLLCMHMLAAVVWEMHPRAPALGR